MTITSNSRNVPLVASIVLLIVAIANISFAGNDVAVRLVDGKKLTAELHPRTSSDHLWLKFGDGGTVILRSIAWARIDNITIGDRTVTATQLQQAASRLETPTPPPAPASEYRSQAEQAHELLGFTRRVTAVDFDARLANWDRDVEFDGIALRLFPLDANGQVTSVRGTLHAELVAGRRTDFNEAPRSRGLVPKQLAKWTIAVDAARVNDDGAVVKLPFKANHPEFDTKWAAHGLVHVRFVVPGHGVFEHSFDGIRVRPFAPLRDELQRQGLQRFLPTEQTGRGKRTE